MSCAVFFALRKCVEEARKDTGETGEFTFGESINKTICYGLFDVTCNKCRSYSLHVVRCFNYT